MRELADIVVMTTPKRRDEAEVLRRMLDLQAKPLGIPVAVSCDEAMLGPMNGFLQVCELPPLGEGHRRLVIHDDLIAPKGVLARLDYILQRLPKLPIVAAYCPANRYFDKARAAGHHLMQTQTLSWAQALAFPFPLLAEYPEVNRLHFEGNRARNGEDYMIGTHNQRTGRHFLNIIPSMFQHLGAFRSTLGFPGKTSRFRYSDSFDPAFDPSGVNWPMEVANPYRAEQTLRAGT